MSDRLSAQTRKYVAVGVAVGVLILVAAGIVHRELPGSPTLRSASAPVAFTDPLVQSPLDEISALLEHSLKSARPLLLGSRDPNGPSCVEITRTGDVKGVMPESKGDLDGGPGTGMALLYFFDRQAIASPMQDYNWHQTRLRTYLENNIVLNIAAQALTHELVEKSTRLSESANTWTALPTTLPSVNFTRQEDWPSYCLFALNKAVSDKDLAATQHWASEFAAACFWLDDILRWRGFLYQNQLAAIDFQAKCESLFKAAEQSSVDYNTSSTLSQFPAGVLGLNGRGNYYEIERQAERLFSMPAERFVEILDNKNWTPNSIWMPPASRAAFLKLRAVLSAENQKTWDLAARTPYERSYLANMLFRSRTVELLDDLAAVLKKFNARNPHAKVGELMGVLMYRGHSFAGIEWGDRFQPQLKEAADKIAESKTDLEALQEAWEWTNHFYQAPAEYGVTLTLRDALEQKKLDCVRATDMIAAIFRNAGRTRLGHVRWCAENGGHSVAAYLAPKGDQTQPLLADGLTPPHAPEAWPECYFHDHPWPAGFETNKPPYAMELYVRGIDSYVWAQGYIARGPNAGMLISAAVPYSTHFNVESSKKVFDGPYPE